MNNTRTFTYAVNGIQRTRNHFLKKQTLPRVLEVPQYFIADLQKVKSIHVDEAITSKYNIAVLTEWIIQDIEEYSTNILNVISSDIDIVLCIMKMMQINQLLKIMTSRQTSILTEDSREMIAQMIETFTEKVKIYSNNINTRNCKIVSENTRKNLDLILSKRNEMIFKQERMTSALLQLDLQCVFSNILLNLRRTIRNLWAKRQEEIEKYYITLKWMEIKLYYISVATFSATKKYVRQLYLDTSSADRSITYCFLVHDERGLSKINHYLHEAPINQLDKDMDFISSTINKIHVVNQEQISSDK